MVGYVFINEYIKYYFMLIYLDRVVKEEIIVGILFFFFYNYKVIYVFKGDFNLLVLKLFFCISE